LGASSVEIEHLGAAAGVTEAFPGDARQRVAGGDGDGGRRCGARPLEAGGVAGEGEHPSRSEFPGIVEGGAVALGTVSVQFQDLGPPERVPEVPGGDPPEGVSPGDGVRREAGGGGGPNDMVAGRGRRGGRFAADSCERGVGQWGAGGPQEG
jgi:hypothetical protein